MDARLVELDAELDAYGMDMKDWDYRGDGEAPYPFPEHVLDELDCDKYMFGPDRRDANRMYWGLIGELAEKAKREYENDDLPVDSLAKAVLDDIGKRKRFELDFYDVSKLVIDKASRITDFGAAPDSEDGRRMKELKREVDVALVLANGNVEGFLYGTKRHCPLNLAAYDTMASMGYRPFLWDGGEPGDDKTPALVMYENNITHQYEGEAYDNVPWEDSVYANQEAGLRKFYHKTEDFRFNPHHIYDQAGSNPPTHHDRMAGTMELFRAVGDIGDVRRAWTDGTGEAERLDGVFQDFDAALVCCNIDSPMVMDSKQYASSYVGIEGTFDEVMAETDNMPQSPVDERGFQMLLDLGYEGMCAEMLDFYADSNYRLKPVDVQQMRVDNAIMDFYTGHDERNGKLVTNAMRMYNDSLTLWWDKDEMSDYVQGELDKMLNPGGDDPKSRALRERLFDQVSTAEILLTTHGDVSLFQTCGYCVGVVDKDCYDRLKSYGYSNPVLQVTGKPSGGDQPQYEKLPLPELNETLRQAHVRQEPVALPGRRIVEPPAGGFRNIPDGLDEDYPII